MSPVCAALGSMNAHVLCGCLTGGAVLYLCCVSLQCSHVCFVLAVHAADSPSHEEEEFVLLYLCVTLPRPDCLHTITPFCSLVLIFCCTYILY